MTSPIYLRYTLHLPSAAFAVGGAPARSSPLPPGDDVWGAAADARRPDPAALDYPHPEAVALIERLGAQGWQEEDDGHTLIFWLEEARRRHAAATLAALNDLGELEATPERPGWDEAWKEFHRPHAVGRLYVRPPWCPARDDLLDLVVDVAQAFGTGGHPTTRQCLAMLQRLPQGALLDLGCGSGVVALGAARLGFGPVYGVDIDAQAVAEAAENARRNRLAAAFVVGDAADPSFPLPDADTVVANIALAPILRLAPRFAPRPGGQEAELRPSHLLLAGLLDNQRDEAVRAFAAYEELDRLVEGEWLLLHLGRRS